MYSPNILIRTNGGFFKTKRREINVFNKRHEQRVIGSAVTRPPEVKPFARPFEADIATNLYVRYRIRTAAASLVSNPAFRDAEPLRQCSRVNDFVIIERHISVSLVSLSAASYERH